MAIKEFNRLASTALGLPTRQRAKKAQALWNSIEDERKSPRITKEELEEIKRRDREITEGGVRCQTHAQIMKAARKALGCPR
jgi:hypothetical protein